MISYQYLKFTSKKLTWFKHEGKVNSIPKVSLAVVQSIAEAQAMRDTHPSNFLSEKLKLRQCMKIAPG